MPLPLSHDHYKVLGVDRHASPTQIRTAFLDRAKQWHPDRNPSPRATEAFQLLNRAYDTLRDPGRRARFDAQLAHCRTARNGIGHPRDITARMTRRRSTAGGEADVRHWTFTGLQLTGLAFSSILVLATVGGIVFRGWPAYVLLFDLPALSVIPDCLRLRSVKQEGRTSSGPPQCP
ncbi:MAG: J domain-containing protein [Flavobacteriales bacterium]|nr:J domain-containing protein [Flavobacteriales bacterium]